MNNLLLLRHGQSQWNREKRFTGWADIDLTHQGRVEAELAGKLIKQFFSNNTIINTTDNTVHNMNTIIDEINTINATINT